MVQVILLPQPHPISGSSRVEGHNLPDWASCSIFMGSKAFFVVYMLTCYIFQTNRFCVHFVMSAQSLCHIILSLVGIATQRAVLLGYQIVSWFKISQLPVLIKNCMQSFLLSRLNVNFLKMRQYLCISVVSYMAGLLANQSSHLTQLLNYIPSVFSPTHKKVILVFCMLS